MSDTRRVRILRALRTLHPAGLQLRPLGDLLGETVASTNSAVVYLLRRLAWEGLVQRQGTRRSYVYRLTDAGLQHLQDIEAGRVQKSRPASHGPHANTKLDRVVVRSVAQAGQAPKNAVASVFDLGGQR